jgi:predicted transcriptional regulator
MHTERVAETKVRTVRVDDKLWETAQEIAAEQRETVAAVIKRALVAYCVEHGREVPR